MVSGHHDPAFTVASFATTTTSRPSTTPTPVMTPAPGAWPSYWSCATSRPSSSQGAPGSSNPCTRSRGESLPCWCILATRAAPPPFLELRGQPAILVAELPQAALLRLGG